MPHSTLIEQKDKGIRPLLPENKSGGAGWFSKENYLVNCITQEILSTNE